MRRRRVRAEEQARDQAQAETTADVARLSRAARIESTPGNRPRVTANVTVTAVNGSPIVKIGNHEDISLVISRAGFDPTLQLTCIIGRTQVRVAIAASDFETTELVYQKDVDHTCHCIGSVNG